YLALARDASLAGDRVAMENYLQHAEHYYRTINADGNRPRPPMRNDGQQQPVEGNQANGQQYAGNGQGGQGGNPPHGNGQQGSGPAGNGHDPQRESNGRDGENPQAPRATSVSEDGED